MKIAVEMKLTGQNIRGVKIFSPEAAGRRQVSKQSILFDGQLVLAIKSVKFHCHKMIKCLRHFLKEMQLGTMGSI